ncbi:vacuolar CLN3 [Scheffersomyces coipomensis]|uniref:vacuolar CLN3 n=1 Tax=Scheffersomyces coipomensis TaxID=1788519 RepID=UPI00315DF546
MLTENQRIFISFTLFGLLNNILYVVILSAAIDLVGASTPKGIVLLADVIPSFAFKLMAPFFIHKFPYVSRMWTILAISTSGMLLISLTPASSKVSKIVGIAVASFSSGIGEVTFLQLTHFYHEESSIGGFSTGTGAAGLLGSFLFLFMTTILGIEVWISLLIFAIVPTGFLFTYYLILPSPDLIVDQYEPIHTDEEEQIEIQSQEQELRSSFDFEKRPWYNKAIYHVYDTFKDIKPLIRPYMLPLLLVYISEYTINQGIAPTLLFPLDDLPHWLFGSYRDIYVVYGFVYQLGVFISRTSINFGIRFRQLYWMAVLQFLNVIITLYQSIYFDFPFPSVWFIIILTFYEGLLGGLSYTNTFMSVSETVPKNKREFSMGSVSLSDSAGVVIAGLLNLWLEMQLCSIQVSKGRDWCLTG